MQTTVQTSDFINALALVNGSIDKRAANPLLSYCKMELRAGNLTLTGFDLKTLTQGSLPDKSDLFGETFVEGAVLVPAPTVLALVQKLGIHNLKLSVVDNTLSINGNYKIDVLPAYDYPLLPSPTGDVISLPVDVLQRHLGFASVSISDDETKHILTGLNISKLGDTVAFAATDGYRLTMTEFETSAEIPSVTVSGDGVRQLMKLIKKCDGDVQIQFDNAYVRFACEKYVIVTRLLDGMYPNYRQLIPKEFSRRVVMNREDVVHALERLAVLAGSRNVVKFSLDLDTLILATDESELGQGHEQIPAEIEGEPLDVAFNVKYVLEGLKAMSTSQVQMRLNSATAPAIFYPMGEDKSLYLVMPIQLRK